MKELFEAFSLIEWLQIIFTAAGVFPALYIITAGLILIGG